MPEETLKYKVEIDDSTLASQLSNIKDRINEAISSNINTNNVVSSIADVTENLPLQNFQNDLATFSEGLNFATHRASSDLAKMSAMVTGPQQQTFSPIQASSYYGQIVSDLHEKSFFGSLGPGMFGSGYNQEMPMSRREYAETARERWNDPLRRASFSYGMSNFGISSLAGATTGAAVGGPWGLAAGLAVDLTTSAYVDWAAKDEKAIDAQARQFREISTRQRWY